MSPARETLRSYFDSHTGEPLRPILTNLNGDGSWLMSFPLPDAGTQRGNGPAGKRFYHVAVDPWLKGPATMFSPWLVYIERTEPAAVPDGAGVDAAARKIEELAAAAASSGAGTSDPGRHPAPMVDAIFITLHLLDHLHRPTLETFDGRVPVFATAQAAATIRGWGHFDTVVETRDYEGHNGDQGSAENAPAGDRGNHWRKFHPGGPLPGWLSVFRLPDNEIELATALVWTHGGQPGHRQGGGAGGEQHELIINTPHGVDVESESVAAFLGDIAGAGSTRCLAMLAGLKDSYTLGMRTTVGVERSLQLERRAGPRYWVRSHDSLLRYGGAVMRARMQSEVVRTLEYGLEEEAKERMREGEAEGLKRPNLVAAGNGGCLVLR